LTIAFKKNKTKPKFYSNLKDTLHNNDKTSIVYEIPCHDCEKVYIGMTKNQLKTRISQHKSNQNKLINSNNIVDKQIASNKTALVQHAYKNLHTFNFDNAKILHVESNNKKLVFSEMLHIQDNKHSVNIKTDTQNLSNSYKAIIHKFYLKKKWKDRNPSSTT
jgi:hypothetical protein